jgi:protocatechuate 3,4-dioxygenase beta subunit
MMKHPQLVIVAGLAMVAAVAGAGQTVLNSDGTTAHDVLTVTTDAGVWARTGLNAPVLVRPGAAGDLQLPALANAHQVVLDAATNKPIEAGSLSWQVANAPGELTDATWESADGALDFAATGTERLTVTAPGYQPETFVPQTDGRRHPVLLTPLGDLRIELQPATEARLWLARQDRINVTSLFTNVAEKYQIDAPGVLEVRDLDREAGYVGLIVAQGKVPVVGAFQGLPAHLTLPLEDGLGVGGTVRDTDGKALAGATIEAMGEIAELDSFRYRQFAKADAEGMFAVGGLLPGTIRVRACAPDKACAEVALEITAEKDAAPVNLELASGRDIVLVVKNEVNTPVADAMLYFSERLHKADHRGQLAVRGLAHGVEIPVKIFGDGFGMWEGSFTADRAQVVITVPGGAVIEQQVLSARRFSPDEVKVRWQAYDPQGRETKSGQGAWDSEIGIARVTGLEAGTYSLSVRLPGSATIISERVEVSVTDQVVLPAAVPERGLAIAGRILDADTLQPLAGAEVSCEPGSPTVFRAPDTVQDVPAVLTDTDGLFLLEGLDAGPCRAIIRAAGFATWRRDGVEPDDVGFDIGDIEMDAGMTIVGRVFDRADRPITGAVVEITEDATYAYFAETTVRTNHDGYFRAERLPVGRWTLTARHGDQKVRETVEGGARETIEADLMLGGIQIDGEIWLGDNRAQGGTLVLTTDGSQAAGVVVMMQRLTVDRQIFGVDSQPIQFTVSADGRFTGRGLDAGRYYAAYTPPDSGSAPVTKILDVPRVENFQCAIQFSDASVDGVVIDTDRRPVAGATVVLNAGDGIQEVSAFTDGDGRFSVRGLEPGRLVLTADHTDFAPSDPSELDLRDGSAEGPLVLELNPPDGANIMLAVSALSGSASGAPVYLVGPETSTGFTDGGGLASFSGISAGSYRPCGFAYGGATGCGENLFVDDGDRLQAQLDLGRGGYVDVWVGSSNGATASATAGLSKRGPSVRVTTADGVDITSLLQMSSPPRPIGGGVRIGPLQSDDYIISIGTENGQRQGQVHIREGEPTELDLS